VIGDVAVASGDLGGDLVRESRQLARDAVGIEPFVRECPCYPRWLASFWWCVGVRVRVTRAACFVDRWVVVVGVGRGALVICLHTLLSVTLRSKLRTFDFQGARIAALRQLVGQQGAAGPRSDGSRAQKWAWSASPNPDVLGLLIKPPTKARRHGVLRGPGWQDRRQPMAQTARLRRRIAGVLSARLPDLQLEQVPDPRCARGMRWQLPALLVTVLAGMLAGCTSLLGVEQLTEFMTRAARRLLGIGRRVPDTTMRTAICALAPEAIRPVIHRQILAAHRRKSLALDALGIGAVAIDGKSTSIPSCDDHYAQRQTAEGGALVGVVRTMTCCLISSAALPCLDAIPIPAETNEMAIFPLCVSELKRVYGHLNLFQLVAADAGSCSQENGHFARILDLHYLFGLKSTQPTLFAEATRVLEHRSAAHADACSEDVLGGERTVVRRLYLTTEMAGYHWEHLQTVLRIESQSFEHGQCVQHDNRYYVCSLAADSLSAKDWLTLIRRYWGVENGPHFTLDVALQEDDHPWIEADPKGALVLVLLRRIAYNLLTLFRSVTLRGELSRITPWKTVLHWFRVALETALDWELAGLRVRIPGCAAASSSQPAAG